MRATLDRLISWTGLLLATVLLIAGGLLSWASAFVNQNVHDQLAAQQITMPPAAALTTQDMKDALSQYAGQPMTTGAQAKAYADHFILAHMNDASAGKTYSQVSGEYLAAVKSAPDAAATKQLGDLRQTMFMGSTLRGLLLYGYAFGMIGAVAGYAAVVAFVGATLFALLGLLGLRHARTMPIRQPATGHVSGSAKPAPAGSGYRPVPQA